MMKHELGRYENYNSNQVTWQTQTPSHWVCNRVKELSIVISKGTTPSTEGFVFTDEGVRFIKAENIVYTKNVSTNPVFHISEEANSALERSQLKVKDLLIVIAGATIGKVGIVVEDLLPANTNQAVCFIRFRKFHNVDFLYYVFSSDYFSKYIWYSIVQSAQPNLSMGVLGNFILFIPPKVEQTTIVAYLDTKTAQIDRKIDLLTQKTTQYGKLKQSLINETVTRGLDKSVAMKDSGVEWIGEVPAHWGISAITNITTTVSIKNHPKEELLSVYRDYGVIIKSTRDDNHNKAGQNLSSYKLVEPGFLVINKMKAWQGSLGVSEFRGIVSPAYITCETDKKIVERSYLHHLLRCRNYINEYNRLSYGVRVDQWDMRYDDFKYVPVLLPPMEEQKAIAAHLDEKTAKINHIVITINTQIEKLKELRKTLINDVVTGKIKVA